MLRTTPLHAGWQFIQTDLIDKKIGFSKSEWLPAQVPGHVHLDLIEAGIIAHPFERMNELGCQWVDTKDWSYQTVFNFNPDPTAKRRVLRFEGLDTVATVSLNGEVVASVDNMFVPLEIDVTDRLQQGDNTLRVDFRSAVNVGLARQAEYFEAQGLGDETGRFGDRAFVRKAQYMYGWDWGPRLVSCGIWKPVSILEYSARILDVHVMMQGDALVATTEIEGEGSVTHALLDAEEETAYLDGAAIPNAPVWPETDALETVLRAPDGTILDTRITAVARKTVELRREPDPFGESFEFVVNGQPVWIRGANWIPDHNFPSAIPKVQLRDRLEKAKGMGFNMLRVWGGGLYESEDFYDLCDELGLLVWQDFPFACGFYPDTDDWLEGVRKEATANIKRLRNRPSLALWCGNNENHQCFIDRWEGDRTPPRYYGINFYADLLPALVSELDPGRAYIPSSATGPKAEPLNNPNGGGFGDQHNWDVWHGRGDWRFYTESTARFSSEYGFGASCSMEAWDTCLSEDDEQTPRGATVRWHDKTGKGTETFIGFVKLHYPDPITLEDWVYYSQLNQRDALRHGVEHYRRSQFCRGSLIWQLNDCWPTQSWAILDNLGNRKALGYELKRLYGDVLFSFTRDNERVELHVINDGSELVSGDLTVRAFSTVDGTLLRSWDALYKASPNSRQAVHALDISGLNVHETLLYVDDPYSDAWKLLGEPKNMRFSPPAELLVSTAEEGFLVISTPTPLVDLMLTDDGSPAPFLTNFLTIPSAGKFVVFLDYDPDALEARSLAGQHKIQVTRSPI